MTDKQGVEIDYCPQCRGIWLDRGELEKIVERSLQYSPYDKEPYHKPHEHGDSYHKDPYYNQKKRKNFLSDLFDF